MTLTMKRISHEKMKRNLLRDPKTLLEYNSLSEEYALVGEMLRARKRAGLTQQNIADKMHTTPSTISRLESLPDKKTKHSPSIDTLRRYAESVNCFLKIKFIAKRNLKHI